MHPQDWLLMKRVDEQRERKFRSIIRKALGSVEDVADILATTDGLLVTLKTGERFTIWVENKTNRDL